MLSSAATASADGELNLTMGNLNIDCHRGDGNRCEFVAGSSTTFLNGLVAEDKLLFNSFSPGVSETFALRVGPNYSRNKMKAPSPKALYDFVGAE
jgi:hypothetical protein